MDRSTVAQSRKAWGSEVANARDKGQMEASKRLLDAGRNIFIKDKEAAATYREYGVKLSKSSFSITPALGFRMSPAWSLRTYYKFRVREGMSEQNINASVVYSF